MIETTSGGSKKPAVSRRQHAPCWSASEIPSSGQKTPALWLPRAGWPRANDASSQLPSRAVTSCISCLTMWWVLYKRTCKGHGWKTLKNQCCRKSQGRCNLKSDSASSFSVFPVIASLCYLYIGLLQGGNTGACKKKTIFEINLRKSNKAAWQSESGRGRLRR